MFEIDNAECARVEAFDFSKENEAFKAALWAKLRALEAAEDDALTDDELDMLWAAGAPLGFDDDLPRV